MWKSNEHSKIAGLYELKNTLGRGHFAVVKLAEHVFSGEKVAVKVIDKTKMDQISADHLYHEVTCMKLVQHPNVVRLYQVIETPSKLYLILELGDGGDMFDYIMRHDKGLHEDKAKEYFAQILNAIAYCHKLHVVHRDLKPENVVFFETQGLVKLTDFGFSNRYRPGEKLSTSCGSLAYSAPEILLGEEYDAPAVDVWSLGVILYMLVCGVAPFNEANDSETLTNIMDCRYKVLDHVSGSCQDLIQRMLIREPSDRISLEAIMSHPWLAGVSRAVPPVLCRSNISDGLHQSVIDTMSEANLACQEEIEKALDEDRYDHITSTYFLLAERALLQQELNAASSQEAMEADDKPEEVPFTPTSSLPIPARSRARSDTDVMVGAKLQTIYSVSPTFKQATLLPPSTSLEPPSRRRTFSSSSEESTSSMHNKNPSFIREHLTITPRHGFSVAHGGIDALIEEEERSKSQTTTDDETDIADQIGDLNPNALANCLQRTSIQRMTDLKRVKKRKSAPVLNEICEEQELEESVEEPSFYRTNFHPSGRHSISTSSPSAHVHRPPNHGGPKGDPGDPPKSKSPIIFVSRTGRSVRRRSSQRSSSSEASEDEECESRRESSTNLSTVVGSLLYRRRDSSDDDDRGFGGRDWRGLGHLEGGTPLDDVVEQDPMTSQDVDDHCGGDGGSGGTQAPTEHFSLNNASELRTFKKLVNLNGTDHRIINVLGIRSRSAESRSSSSYSGMTSRSCSSARSSCSSLSNHYRMRPLTTRGARRSMRNSSSTRSDTGLVFRRHVTDLKLRLNNAKFMEGSLSFTSLDPAEPQLRGSSSLDYVVVNNEVGNFSSNSLPRRHRKGKRSRKTVHPSNPTAADGNPQNLLFTPFGYLGDGMEATKSISHESVAIAKRSNLSLASSTCSASKFVVDPVNELPPSPCLPPLPETTPKESPHPTEELMFTFPDPPFGSGASLKPKDHGILTKLNNLKNASAGSRGALSSGRQPKNALIRRVKHRDCCAIM